MQDIALTAGHVLTELLSKLPTNEKNIWGKNLCKSPDRITKIQQIIQQEPVPLSEDGTSSIRLIPWLPEKWESSGKDWIKFDYSFDDPKLCTLAGERICDMLVDYVRIKGPD